ncbi:Afadin, partial [Paragonimus heterotremus]
RRLTNDEYPLLVQLNWSKLDREGKFVLKAESAGDNAQAMNGSMKKPGSSSSCTITTNGGNGRIRRRWSLRKDKQFSPCSQRGPLGCAAAVGWTKDKPVGRARQSFFDPKLNCLVMSQHSVSSTSKKLSSTSPPPPDSSFTRTISNPEQVMQRKRQRTLEAKLLDILQHGGPNIGGTLKIYGGHICPQVPYKTLLLSVTDTVADVIRQSLDKYGMEEADADAYCLVLRVRTAADTTEGRSGTERVLADTDFPLAHLFASTPEAGSVVTFELQPRPPHLLNQRLFFSDISSTSRRRPNTSHPDANKRVSSRINRASFELDTVFACLIELDPCIASDPVRSDTAVKCEPNCATGTVYALPVHKGQVCIGTAPTPDFAHPFLVTLPLPLWPGVELHHLIIWRPPVPPGISSAKAASDATTRRGGWLACRPCLKSNSCGAEQFSKVYVNNRLLTPTPENHACVYWLSPGDILHLGTGRRCLKIWPGNGSKQPTRSALVAGSLPYPSVPRSGLVVPEVPKHQRMYNSNLSSVRSPTPPTVTSPLVSSRFPDNSGSLPMTTPVYLSPLVQSSSPLPSELSVNVPQAHRTSTTAYTDFPDLANFVRTPIESNSDSSSSLSSNPPTETFPGARTDHSLQPYLSIWLHSSSSEVHVDSLQNWSLTGGNIGEPSSRLATRLVQSSVTCTSTSPDDISQSSTATVSVQMRRAAPFHPIPVGESMQQPSSSLPASKSLCSPFTPELSKYDRNASSIGSPPLTSSSCHSPTRPTGSNKSSHRSKSSSSTISDRLPCQMAFAPASVGHLLDWLIMRSMEEAHLPTMITDQSVPPPVVDKCPLGPAISVYLMLRAIYRQCDRWDMIETRQAVKDAIERFRSAVSGRAVSADGEAKASEFAKAKLAVHQHRRRQRELLSLLAGSVERFQNIETVLTRWINPCDSSPVNNCDPRDRPTFQDLLHSNATWLANASQLLHLITRDVDLTRTFEDSTALHSSSQTNAEYKTSYSTWMVVQDQLTDVVQSSFGMLTDLCVSQLDQVSIPQLLSQLTEIVHAEEARVSERDLVDEDANVLEEAILKQPDAVLQMLTDTLDSLHAAYVNPAFVVQLFARMLHRLNARLFNFLLGTQTEDESTSHQSDISSHISPTWGRVLHRWIRVGICNWALTEGLGVAAECYLQRVSQAAELMMADLSTVECLYNVAVDLVGLNSRQVRALLTGYRRDGGENQICSMEDGRIPGNWIDFVVSGVQLVADRILAEEETAQAFDPASETDKSWNPHLEEPLDLLLPLLLPEDSYPSDMPIPLETSEDPVSCDSGISSRPSSAKEQDSHKVEKSPSGDPLITVDAIRKFLQPAIKAGWCRLSVRPICDKSASSPPTTVLLQWNAYLTSSLHEEPTQETGVSASAYKTDGDNCFDEKPRSSDPADNSPSGSTELTKMESSSDSCVVDMPSTVNLNGNLPCASMPLLPNDVITDKHPSGDDWYVSTLCSKHRPITVLVPKIGQSLGLNIVAAKSEDGRDLGIYVRGVVPESGASQARLYQASANNQSDPEPPLLKPGDHLLAVNDQSVLELSQEAAAQLVASAGPEVSLTVVRNSTMCTALAKSAEPRSVYRSSSTTSTASESNEILCENCPECRLQASLITSPVNLIISDNKDSEPHRISSTDVAFSVSSERSLDRIPPPVPSALGPVLHLFEPKPRTSVDCIAAHTTRAFNPKTWADAYSSNDQHLMFRSINSRLQSPEPAIQYNHQSPPVNNVRITAYNSSFSTSALHQAMGNRWTSEYSTGKTMPSATGRVSESRSTLNDLEEPVGSEYSLGTSTGPVDSSCSSLLWRTHASIPQPCHRPKGQSASFDEWLSTTRLGELCERFTNELTTRVNANVGYADMLPNSRAHISEQHPSITDEPRQSSEFVNTETESFISSAIRTSALPSTPGLYTNQRSRSLSTNAKADDVFTDVHQPSSCGSKAPLVFVPTVSVLPSIGQIQPAPGPRTNGHPPLPSTWWSSRSLGDLNDFTHSPQSSSTRVSVQSSTLGRTPAGRAVQRRHTTLTTSRFNLGPRPVPPNQDCVSQENLFSIPCPNGILSIVYDDSFGLPVSSTCRKYLSHPICILANEHRFICLPGLRYHTQTHTHTHRACYHMRAQSLYVHRQSDNLGSPFC